MELKVGDKIIIKKEINPTLTKLYDRKELGIICGKAWIVTKIIPSKVADKHTKIKIGCWEITPEWIDLEETSKLNKIKMVIGENRTVECGEYKVEWYWGDSCFVEGDNSKLTVRDKDGTIMSLGFTKHNYKQQMEIANLILDKLGLNVELVEENKSEIIEQIGKLEVELEKLRGMVR